MTTTTDPKREPGYRGSLPPREDRLARPWLLIVAGIFVLVIVLSVAGVPSRFIPDPTPIPIPSFDATPSPSATEDASADPSATDAASPDASPSGSPGTSASPSSEASASP